MSVSCSQICWDHVVFSGIKSTSEVWKTSENTQASIVCAAVNAGQLVKLSISKVSKSQDYGLVACFYYKHVFLPLPFSVSIHLPACLFTLGATVCCVVRGRVPKPVGKTVKCFVPRWGHVVSVHSRACSAALAVVFTSLMTASALHQRCRSLTVAQSMIGRCPRQRRRQATASLHYCFLGSLFVFKFFCSFFLRPPYCFAHAVNCCPSPSPSITHPSLPVLLSIFLFCLLIGFRPFQPASSSLNHLSLSVILLSPG